MEVARKGLLPDIGMGRTGGGGVGGLAEVLAGLGCVGEVEIKRFT